MAEKDKDLLELATTTAGGEKPTYSGTFDQQLDDIYNKIVNREPFSYDVNADPLYQGFKDKYVQQGKLAMKDTMGQAAALTGGYGSTYGQQVGQQAYDSYLRGLGDVIPDLYNLALQAYQNEGDQLTKQYNMLGQRRDTEYSKWRDELGDWNYQQELARQQEQTDYSRRISEENTAYSRQKDAYNTLYTMMTKYGYNPSDEELAAAGMNRSVANTILAAWLAEHPEAVAVSGEGGNGKDVNKKDLKEYLSYLEASGYTKGSQLYQTVARQAGTWEAKSGNDDTKTKKGNGGR